MNVLFISAIFPYPLYSGGQVRIYNLLKRLSKRHAITLCAFIRRKEELEYVSKLSFCKEVFPIFRGYAWNISYMMQALIGRYPFLMSTYNIQKMKTLVQQKVLNNDIVHIEPAYVWPVVESLDLKTLVVCEHNIEYTIYQSYADQYKRYPLLSSLMRRDVYKLRYWEEYSWKKAQAVVAVSEEDADAMRKVKPEHVHVILNGVDETFFLYRPKTINKKDATCLFVGNFRWIQNVDALDALLNVVWPAIHHRFPYARLKIIGQDLPKKWKRFHSSVTYIPQVEDIRDFLYESDIVLAPIRIGGGTKYKILEAMASGRMVITTAKGAEGLPLIHKKHCLIVDDLTDWGNAIEFIFQNSSLHDQIVKQARELIEERYIWSQIATNLSSLWEAYRSRS